MLNHRGVHNFSPGVLDAYFKFNELVDKGRITPLSTGLGFYVDRGSRKMTMLYSKDIDVHEVAEYQCQGPVYSIDRLLFEGAVAFVEVAYNTDAVFDKNSYKNAKKRHQRIVYPFKWIEKQDIIITPLTKADEKEALLLHDEWAEKKLDDPKTFKIMFPNARYNRCVKLCLLPKREPKPKIGFDQIPDISVFPNYVGFVARRENKIIAVRVVDCQSPYCFDLAFFGNTWSEPSQLMNYLDIVTLHMLKDDYDIKIFNCGAAMSTSLKHFKSHIPSFEVISWRYKKIKK